MLRDGLLHHVWATERMLDLCETLSDEQLAQPVPAIYGSALDTLRHLVDADNWYLRCISEGELGIDDLETDGLSLAQLRPIAAAAADGWLALLDRQIDLDAMLASHSKDGNTRRATAGLRLAQVLHHGSDHRSQVCTALTTLGLEPPELDVWEWGEVTGRSSWEPPLGSS